MFNYQFLHTFLSVYRLGSQTKAASELRLTQPAVFQQMRHLEAEIGKPLFTRVGKHIKPTPAAHQLALRVAPHLDGIERAWDSLSESSDSKKGLVYVGGIAEFFATTIAPHLGRFLEPEIQIRFDIGYDGLAEKLVQGKLDLAQFTAHIVYPGVEIESIYHEHFVLVGHPKWQEAIDTKALQKNDTRCLDAVPWLSYDESLLYIKDYYRNLFDRSFAGNVRLMIRDLWGIRAALRGGLGITVLPSYFCKEDLAKKRLVTLYTPKENLKHILYLGWKVGALRSTRVSKVRDAIKAALGVF